MVQIENTEQLPPEASGRQRVRIVKAGLPELCQNLPGWSTAGTGTELGRPGAQAARGPGDDVRAVGSDIKAGEVVLHRGDRLGAAEIGLLATVGAADLQVCSGLPVRPFEVSVSCMSACIHRTTTGNPVCHSTPPCCGF